jgi:hypothetical protein
MKRRRRLAVMGSGLGRKTRKSTLKGYFTKVIA